MELEAFPHLVQKNKEKLPQEIRLRESLKNEKSGEVLPNIKK